MCDSKDIIIAVHIGISLTSESLYGVGSYNIAVDRFTFHELAHPLLCLVHQIEFLDVIFAGGVVCQFIMVGDGWHLNNDQSHHVLHLELAGSPHQRTLTHHQVAMGIVECSLLVFVGFKGVYMAPEELRSRVFGRIDICDFLAYFVGIVGKIVHTIVIQELLSIGSCPLAVFHDQQSVDIRVVQRDVLFGDGKHTDRVAVYKLSRHNSLPILRHLVIGVSGTGIAAVVKALVGYQYADGKSAILLGVVSESRVFLRAAGLRQDCNGHCHQK